MLKRVLLGVVAVSVLPVHAPVSAESGWSVAEPVAELNSTAADGCPIESPNGRSFYLASTRPGGLGGNDIWVAHRRTTARPWSTPEQLAEPVNSTANDFCPTPLPGGRLLFVSERSGAEHLQRRTGRWRHLPDPAPPATTRQRPPRHLGCVAAATDPTSTDPSSARRSSPPMTAHGSSSRAPATTPTWICTSANVNTTVPFGPPTKIVELSTTADDRMPNVSRDGLTMVFVSNRTDLPGALGGFDVFLQQPDEHERTVVARR